MKKTLLAAGILLATTSLKVNAQDQGFHAGLTTGYYYTTILDKGLFDSPTYDHQTTFRAAPIGLALGYQWEGGNGIQVEVISAKIGQEMDIKTLDAPGGNFIVSGKKEINLNYIQIPVLFKKQFGEGKAKFNFHLGPQISLMGKGQDVETFSLSPVIYTGTGDNYQSETPGEEKIIGSTEKGDNAEYEFNKTAIGGLVGFGVDYFFNENLYLSGNLRLGYNFTEIRKEEGGSKFVDTATNTSSEQVKLYQSELRSAAFGGIQIGIHYMFLQ